MSGKYDINQLKKVKRGDLERWYAQKFEKVRELETEIEGMLERKDIEIIMVNNERMKVESSLMDKGIECEGLKRTVRKLNDILRGTGFVELATIYRQIMQEPNSPISDEQGKTTYSIDGIFPE